METLQGFRTVYSGGTGYGEGFFGGFYVAVFIGKPFKLLAEYRDRPFKLAVPLG